MFCANCGSAVNENESFCGVCGARIEREKVNSEESNVVQETETTQTVEEPQVAPEVENNPDFAMPVTETPAPKKKAKKGKVVGVLAAVIVAALAGVGGFVFANGGFKNFWYKNFASPESYFKYVVEKRSEEALNSAKTSISEVGKSDKDSWQGSVELELEAGKELKTLLKTANKALADLDNVSVVMGANANKDIQNIQLKAKINDGNIVTINMTCNIEENILYFQIPELSDKCVDLSKVLEEATNTDEYEEYMEQVAMLREKFQALEKRDINLDTVISLVDKYLKVAYDKIEDVDKSKDEIEVDGISQKCTVLEATLDGDYAYNVAEDVLKTLAKDKDIKAILEELGDVDPDDFEEQIESLIDELDKEDFEGDGEIKFALYLNVKSEIVGMTVDVNEEVVISMLCPKNGSKVGFELKAEAYGEEIIVLEGSGTEKKDVLNGTYKLSVTGYEEDGKDIVTFEVKDFDLKAFEDGKLNGTVVVTTTAMEELEDYALSINFKSADTTTTIAVSVLSGKTTWGTLRLTINEKSEAKELKPSKKNTIVVEDEDDLMEYAADIDIEGFIEDAIDASGLNIKMSDLEGIFEDLIGGSLNEGTISSKNDYDYDYDYDYDVYDDDPNLTVKMGDTINIDYAGVLDHDIFDEAEGVVLTIGSNTFIDDFEEQLIGLNPGDVTDVYVTFPEDYGVDELNGQEAMFEVTVNGIY